MKAVVMETVEYWLNTVQKSGVENIGDDSISNSLNSGKAMLSSPTVLDFV